MALVETPNVETGWQAVNFALPGVDGKTYSLADAMGENGLVVMFICNHCPYVKAIVDRIVADMAELKKHGIGAIAVMPNDTQNYPDDSFENMKTFASANGFGFPYVIDETQEIAKAYDAVCTPDFFGFDRDLKLQYRGRLDASRKEAVPGARRDLVEAMKEVAAKGSAPQEQFHSMGCSIKWRE